jgi:VPDSG-CTERM motif
MKTRASWRMLLVSAGAAVAMFTLSSQAEIIETVIDFSTYPALPFTASGNVARSYENWVTYEHIVLSAPIRTSASGIVAEHPTRPGWPWVPGPYPNPWCSFSLSFSPNVIGFQIAAIPDLPPLTQLITHSGGSWTFEDVNPLLDPYGQKYFASEGNYIERAVFGGPSAGFAVTRIKLYSDTQLVPVPVVPDGGATFALLGFGLLAISAGRKSIC